jgi:hypothetical protein
MSEMYSHLNVSELCDKLQLNETAQQNIYDTYRRAAEFDEALRELKKEERRIRLFMNAKIGM